MKRAASICILAISFIACALLEACAPLGSVQHENRDVSLFPGAEQYEGETVRLITYDTVHRNIELQLDSIGDESESSYRSRYGVFIHDEPDNPAALTIGEPVVWIHHEKKERYLSEHRFSGYTPRGILFDSLIDISVGSLPSSLGANDTITTASKRKCLTGATLLRDLQNNDLPVRATFFFSDTADASTQYVFKNCEFDRATIKPHTSLSEAPQTTLLEDIAGGVIKFVVDLIVDPPHSDTSSTQEKKKEDAKVRAKKGRITAGEVQGKP